MCHLIHHVIGCWVELLTIETKSHITRCDSPRRCMNIRPSTSKPTNFPRNLDHQHRHGIAQLGECTSGPHTHKHTHTHTHTHTHDHSHTGTTSRYTPMNNHVCLSKRRCGPSTRKALKRSKEASAAGTRRCTDKLALKSIDPHTTTHTNTHTHTRHTPDTHQTHTRYTHTHTPMIQVTRTLS